jgi:hypothetical protein
MRLWAFIALALVGCASSSKTQREIKPAEVAVEPTAGTAAAQSVTTKALDNALGKTTVDVALKAMATVSKVAIEEGRAKSVQLTNEKAVSNVTKVAAIGLGISFLAFVFGSYVGISKLASAASAGLCLGVAVSAPALLEALGTQAAQWIIVSCFGVLFMSIAVSIAWLAVDKARDMARRSR